jgi:hypothetical protein
VTPRFRHRAVLIAALVALLGSGCSVRKVAINGLADALADAGRSFASDSDPELVGDALPFALKTMESLLESSPEHRGLLLSACRGFTQYGYAFVELHAEEIEPETTVWPVWSSIIQESRGG